MNNPEHPSLAIRLAEGAWLAREARRYGYLNIWDLDQARPEYVVERLKEFRDTFSDEQAAATAFPFPKSYLEGDPFVAPGGYGEDVAGGFGTCQSLSRPPRIRPTGRPNEIRDLIDAAIQQGRVFSSRLRTLIGAQGGEHDVILTPVRVLKITKADSPSPYGRIIDPSTGKRISATPQEYAKRLRDNEVIEDDQRLEGVMENVDGSYSIVTSQTAIAGAPPSATALAAYLESAGFRQIEGTQSMEGGVDWYSDAENLYISDAKPDNFAQHGTMIVAIDVVTTRPAGEFLRKLVS